MGDEGREHQHQHGATFDQQSAVADGFTLVERHDIGNSIGFDRDRAEQAGQHSDEGDQHNDYQRCQVQHEVVERQSRPAGHDDVRRVTHQRRGATNVGGEDFGHQERRRVDV